MTPLDNEIKLILASASPRRSFFLRELGLHFEVFPADVDETVKLGEAPVEFARRLAVEKARAPSPLPPMPCRHGVVPPKGGGNKGGDGKGGISAPVYSLGADTIVVFGGKIYGKPRHEKEAITFWQELGGQTHEVITAFAIVAFPDRIVCVETATTAVTLKRLSENEIREYLSTGEPFDKAGAYAAQGIGKKYVEKIEGSITNVIGLPLEVLIPWLKKLKLL